MTYVDQCDTIRTLTEEEMAVVSGGSIGPGVTFPIFLPGDGPPGHLTVLAPAAPRE
jgi:hypothetical protein